ncbi:MAG TPA: NAD-dependent epimerase/dehydratase family protein [Methylophilaceae bacterium]|nr:NAD-dependent epimerase/dehydratase family protein [Methylophilaceae bacterium]
MLILPQTNNQEKSVLVTGASGFIGSALCKELIQRDFKVSAVIRRPFDITGISHLYQIDDLSPDIDWHSILIGKGVIVHLAARAHVLTETNNDAEDLYIQTNTLSTLNLANQAAKVGVKRFIFISSIGVHGSKTQDGEVFNEQSDINPHNAYTRSKWSAEQALNEIALNTSMEVVILRPTLVYGPEPKGNFLTLLKLVHSGLPLPFGGIDNLRSFIYLGNLVDVIIKCVKNPNAAGKTYVLSDGEDISTGNLMKVMAKAINSNSYIFAFPRTWLRLGFKMLGKSQTFDKFSSSLVVDSSKVREDLNWLPPYTLQDGIKHVAEWFVKSKKSF